MPHTRIVRCSALLPASLLALGLLAGCGGNDNGSDGSPPPTATPPPAPQPPANSAPVFTSPANASAAEDTTAAAVFYTATATDADSDPLTYTISGGADAARFQITAAGALSFIAAPDFENPADADQNNVYLVEIRVSDGKTAAILPLSVSVTDDGRVRFTNVTGVRFSRAGYCSVRMAATLAPGCITLSNLAGWGTSGAIRHLGLGRASTPSPLSDRSRRTPGCSASPSRPAAVPSPSTATLPTSRGISKFGGTRRVAPSADVILMAM